MNTVETRIDVEDEDDLAWDWPIPWHAYVPGAALVAAMAVAWIAHMASGLSAWVASGGMAAWGVSGAALAEGRFETIGLHMFAHGGLAHILMNSAALFEISAPIVAGLGAGPKAWLRFLALFVLSGLAGMAFFLAVHPQGEVPMLGASGAIYGLVGLLLRQRAGGDGLVPIRSRRMRREAVRFLKDNLFLFVLLTVPALLAGQAGGVAWEAHLGGFLFGLLVAPRLFPPLQLRPA